MHERGLAESRAKAQALIMAGEVRVDGQIQLKSSTMVESEVHLELEKKPRFVSRGGEKLESALDHFDIQVTGRCCVDVGASTGGFTDCLLQHGAIRVYALDVGKGGLHWKLRNDPRVVVMESTNARYVEYLPEEVSLAVVDASFISLKILLPVVYRWIEPNGEILCLVKPQFEAGKRDAARGSGVIRAPAIHKQILSDIAGFAESIGLGLHGLIRSPILGAKGNLEFLLWLKKQKAGVNSRDLIASIGIID